MKRAAGPLASGRKRLKETESEESSSSHRVPAKLKFLTFRISRVPGNTTAERLRESLEISEISAGTESEGRNVVALSLAPNIVAHEDGPVATVTFRHTSSRFATSSIRSIVLYIKEEGTQEKEYIVDVDRHFVGLTPLSSPTIEPNVEWLSPALVAMLSGRRKHKEAFLGSWEMWLRDFLPGAVPEARILTYGYDTKLEGSKSNTSVFDLAKSFLEAAKTARQGKKGKNRAIIFIGHSLGGLITKQALVKASSGDKSDRTIFNCTYGLLLFGVPNRGLQNESLKAIVAGQPNQWLVDNLEELNPLLRKLHNQFMNTFIFWDSKIISFYETMQSPTVQQCPKTGEWSRTGKHIMMVSQDSATYSGKNEQPYDQIPLNSDHSGLVKFSSHNDQEYRVVERTIKELVLQAPETIERRFRETPSLSKDFIEGAEPQDSDNARHLTLNRSVVDIVDIADLVAELRDALCNSHSVSHNYDGLMQELYSLRCALLEAHSSLLSGRPRGKEKMAEYVIQKFAELSQDDINSFMKNIEQYQKLPQKSGRKCKVNDTGREPEQERCDPEEAIKLRYKLSGHRAAILCVFNLADVKSDLITKEQNKCLLLDIRTNMANGFASVGCQLEQIIRPVDELGYNWRTDLEPLKFLDVLGTRTILPMELCFTREEFNNLLQFYFRNKPGSKKVMRRQYQLAEGRTGNLIAAGEWETKVTPGTIVEMSVQLSSTSPSRNKYQCPVTTCGFKSNEAPKSDTGYVCQRCSIWFAEIDEPRITEVPNDPAAGERISPILALTDDTQSNDEDAIFKRVYTSQNHLRELDNNASPIPSPRGSSPAMMTLEQKIGILKSILKNLESMQKEKRAKERSSAWRYRTGHGMMAQARKTRHRKLKDAKAYQRQKFRISRRRSHRSFRHSRRSKH